MRVQEPDGRLERGKREEAPRHMVILEKWCFGVGEALVLIRMCRGFKRFAWLWECDRRIQRGLKSGNVNIMRTLKAFCQKVRN